PHLRQLTWKASPLSVYFVTGTATTEIYTLSLHDALPICTSSFLSIAGHGSLDQFHAEGQCDLDRLMAELSQFVDLGPLQLAGKGDRKSTRLNSSHVAISYAVFGLEKKKARKRAGKRPEAA